MNRYLPWSWLHPVQIVTMAMLFLVACQVTHVHRQPGDLRELSATLDTYLQTDWWQQLYDPSPILPGDSRYAGAVRYLPAQLWDSTQGCSLVRLDRGQTRWPLLWIKPLRASYDCTNGYLALIKPSGELLSFQPLLPSSVDSQVNVHLEGQQVVIDYLDWYPLKSAHQTARQRGTRLWETTETYSVDSLGLQPVEPTLVN